ncbi:dicarboxylate/amino acid:cation symporter [Methanobrevibacter sp.]
MFSRLKKISLNTWILIAIILGLITGLFLNLFVDNYFIKNVLLMDNILYLGGNVFIRLLKMIVVPLVFFSIIAGMISISDTRQISMIGLRTLLLYLITYITAVSIALGVGFLIKPGLGINFTLVAQTSNMTLNETVPDTILSIIPENPLNALASGDILPIIIIGVIIGFILVKLKKRTPTVNSFVKEINDIMMQMTGIIMKFTPIGVFCLMATTFGTLGFTTIMPLIKYIVCILAALAIQTFIVYPILLVIYTKANPLRFFKKFISVMFFAFSSTSSNATIPLSMNAIEKMGISEDINSFATPLGATLNKDGTAIMQCIAAMFVAQAYGIDLGIAAILTIAVSTIIASTNTPSVPLSGIVTLSMVFQSVGLPIGAIGVITSIDHILDMFRTAVNVTGDAICTIITAVKNGSFDINVFDDNKQLESKKDMS